MWYAVWVKTGEEEKVKMMCQMLELNVMEDCVIPRYQCMKRYGGAWHKEQELLYPGYLFVKSGQPEQLYKELKNIPEFTKILGDEEMLIPLYEHEIIFLEQCSRNQCVVEMSYGYMIGDQIIITEGPLKDYKGEIKRIDRHKRLATLETSFFGRTMEIKIGLEIVKKMKET